MRRLGSKIVLLVVFVSLVAMTWFVCPAFAEDPIVLPPGFEATQIGDNGFLSKPTAVAFAPDGRVFVLDEGYGTGPGTKDGPQVKVKEPGSSVYRRLFKFDHVNVKQDRGLVGMALENEFDTPGHNFMYLLYTYEPSGGPSNSAEARTQRLVRVEVPETIPSEPFEPAQEVLLGSVGTPVSATQACPYPKTPEGSFDPSGDWKPYDHTDCIPSDADEHAVDSVMVDPQDGTLWISIGDGSGGGSSPVPIAYRSQAIDSLSGKLLHVNRNGEGLEGNGTCPGVTDFDRNCTKVYARGLRNPFRFSFRPDGKVAVGDVGWETREEIDLLSSGGKDLGWPCYEGSVQTPLWKDRPECKAFYTSGTPTQSPVYDYPYPPGVGGAAVILGPTYEGTGQPSDYPDEYSGALFFSDYVSSKVSYAKFDAGGSLISGYPKTFGELPEAVDWQLAPNGDLVYVDIGFGAAGDAEPAIYEISAVENKRPVAKIELAGSPYGASPLEAKFKGSGSSDPDPGETATLSYAWDLDGDGKFDDSSEANPPPQEYTDGSKNVLVKLKVTDIHGKSDIASIALFPGDHQPQITTDPGNPTMYRGGEEIELKASAGDPDSENASLHWHALINHNNTHVHDLNSGEGDAFAFETDTDHDQPSTYEVEIYAEDERGLRTDLPNLVLKPETSTLQITSTPIGAVVTHGGSDHTTPYTGKSTIGVEVGISTVESFVSGGVEYQFDSWSNGKPRSQVVTMPEGGLSLTATYIADFTLKLKKEGTGTGTVTSSPAGISCGGTCSFEFAEGKEVTLTATPEGGSTFAGWSGSGCSGTSTCKVTMSAAKEVTATFNLTSKPEGDGGLDKSSDIFPAALAFNTKKGLTKGHKQSLRGSAEDASGLRKVQVALRESQKVKGRCRWWSQAKGDFPRGTASCAHPGYMKAILNGSGDQVSWTLPLKGHLPKGSYVLVFRTEDAAGNVGQSQTRLPVK
ncbi:MAG TPA: PQQ-dependent sugar dehydrogenase [Solirubrobacterales bacterium]